jgi:starvation-inducible DNA-binding protein
MNDHKGISGGLLQLLGDTFNTYLKSRNYYCNMNEKMFNATHALFEYQHTELTSGYNSIAERIKALGLSIPAIEAHFYNPDTIHELTKDASSVPTIQEIAKEMLEDQEMNIKTARSIFLVAKKSEDEETADLMTQRIQAHAKVFIMLKNLLNEGSKF